MILKNFDSGWRQLFEPKLELVFKYFPDTVIENIERYNGMLRIKLKGIDNDIQYVLDCMTYKIERDSAKTCEHCGNTGRRVKDDTFLKEIRCFCWKCYAIEIDSMEVHNK